ncbi:MAG: protein-L-isoaspartate(D-aspartate) O-methyltransferase [Rhodospirillaceae bacterium]|nr:protein-L-isoaspartate(D-aspartate) O-methyltransferase [Rhodospirillaceae bacterium]MYB11846.1 protein-L-isoaspartate(D-aspartate) O-methyltransferase [Rhodospirillaceae bacterium]MYI48226.1 protein-L-isoaspartate(D-aspartate) O-methyltransferase [Rhodospirillaceae bacterium]
MIAETRKIRLIMELRQGGVTQTDVLTAIEKTPREEFVPELFRESAYDNRPLPIGADQTISQPLIVGLMTQALAPDRRCKVLEIGTGSGYQTAILARLARRVYSVERIRDLYLEAVQRFDRLGIGNVTARIGDGGLGWPEQAPFDRIIVTAAADRVPQALLDQLRIGGSLVIPVGAEGAAQTLWRIERTGEGFEEEPLTGVRFVPLVSGTVG